jgi:uncharacterized protein (UPF0212 family)
MTSPVETIEVACPDCGRQYETQFRASMNLQLDNFDDDYVREMSTGRCPACGHVVELGALVVGHDGVWRRWE